MNKNTTQEANMHNTCPNCAPHDCYHICPNSPHYYSAEQERADDPFYGDDDMSERYASSAIDGELDYADDADDVYGLKYLIGSGTDSDPVRDARDDDLPF